MVVHGKRQEVQSKYELVYQMKFIEGKTWTQIAKRLDMPATSLDRIKRKIRRDLHMALAVIKTVRQWQ